jgi:fatty acid desaturase
MTNLEGIAFNEVSDSKGTIYSSYRKTLKANFTIVWRDITIGYFLLVATVVFYFILEKSFGISWLTIISLPFVAFIAAFWLAFIQLFVHEAAHYNIHPNKKTNDLLANIFLCVILGVNIKSYRLTHSKHHVKLGQTEDTEHSYFNKLTPLFVLKMLTGIHVLDVLKSRNKLNNAQTEKSLSQSKSALLLGALLNFSFLLVLVIFGYFLTAALWIATVIVFYPFFATIRQLLEHRGEEYNSDINFKEINHGKNSRLFKSNLFSYFMGGAGFDRHLLHHWDPEISYTRLKDVERFLSDTEKCGPIVKEAQTGYFETFLKLIK